MNTQKVKKIHMWCQICDTAILTGTVCPVCKTDMKKFKKKEHNFNRKALRD